MHLKDFCLCKTTQHFYTSGVFCSILIILNLRSMGHIQYMFLVTLYIIKNFFIKQSLPVKVKLKDYFLQHFVLPDRTDHRMSVSLVALTSEGTGSVNINLYSKPSSVFFFEVTNCYLY